MIRAHIYDRYGFGGFGLNVAIVMHPSEGAFDTKARILHFDGDGRESWDEIEQYEPIGRPTFHLPEGADRALLEALNAHFGNVEDARMLRKDHDAERARVDKLTDAMVEIARTATRPPEPWPLGMHPVT